MAFEYYIKNFTLLRFTQDRVPGPYDAATKISTIIQELIDNSLITSLNIIDVNILSLRDTVVKARYAGVLPSAALSGTTDEFVTITIPEGCIPLGFKVEGLPTQVDDEFRRTVIFTGSGVPGNTSTADIMMPLIGRAALTTSFGPPAVDNPWSVQAVSQGDTEIVGVGTTATPSLSLRLTNLNTLEDKHLLQFLW